LQPTDSHLTRTSLKAWMCRLQWPVAGGVIIGLYSETTAAVQAAEKPNRAVGRGFIPGKRLIESARASAPEVRSSASSLDRRPFSAACVPRIHDPSRRDHFRRIRFHIISPLRRTIGVKRVRDGNRHIYTEAKDRNCSPAPVHSVRDVPGPYPGKFTPQPPATFVSTQ